MIRFPWGFPVALSALLLLTHCQSSSTPGNLSEETNVASSSEPGDTSASDSSSTATSKFPSVIPPIPTTIVSVPTDDNSPTDTPETPEDDSPTPPTDEEQEKPKPNDPSAAEPAPWQAPGTIDATTFAWGIQITDASSNSVLSSLRTREPAVRLILMRAENDGWVMDQQFDEVSVPDSITQTELTNLIPDTVYSLVAYSADGNRRSRVSRFRTALGEGQSRILRFGATSCLGGANRPFPTLSRAAEENLDFFLMGGDTVYADGSLTFDDYRGVWEEAFNQQGLQDLFASTSVIGVWDDHEVTNDWSWTDLLISDRYDAARATYYESLPWREGPAGTGMWRRLNWGNVLDVYALDTRGERYDGNYISQEQMDWLKAWLIETPSTFKIILNSVPITNMMGMYGPLAEDDRWDGYSHQRDELLEYIVDNNIEGILWVAGDFHFSQLGKVDPPGKIGHNLWEVFAGPAGSFVNPIVWIAQENDQYHHILKTYTYTWFEADPDAGTIRVKFINDDGNVVVEKLLQLTNAGSPDDAP